MKSTGQLEHLSHSETFKALLPCKKKPLFDENALELVESKTHEHKQIWVIVWGGLDGRNRAIVIAESLARVISAIRITSVRWQSYLPPEHRN